MNAGPHRQLTTRDTADQIMVSISGEVEAGLPQTVSVEKFKAAFLTAAVNNPEIFKCEQNSIRISLLRCAADGLVPDGRQAALVPFKGRCTYMPMVQGIIKRAKELGDISRIDAQSVHENDEFERLLGDDDRIFHRPPPLSQPRGAIIGAYAIFYGPAGSPVHREVMTRHDLDKVRGVSRSGGAVWRDWEGEMCRKSAIRRGSKYVPMSDALRQIITRDDEMVDLARAEPTVSPAMTRLAAARAPQTADTGRQIIEHTEREIAATQGATAHEDDITDIEPAGTAGYNDGEPEAGGEADGNGAEGSRLAPEQLDVLERLSAALFRATSKAGLKSYAGHFWGENGGAPEKGSPMHDAAGRVWRQHEVRVTGAVDAEGCRAAVDQIIGEVA